MSRGRTLHHVAYAFIYTRVRSRMKEIAKNDYFQLGNAEIDRFHHAKSKNGPKIKFACANIF